MPIDAQMDDSNDDEDLISSDERRPRRLLDHLRQNDADFSDSDDEGEGGRRNHSRYRDKDSIESNGNHKFGIGGGILTSGPANTHGAGPSAHTRMVLSILSTLEDDDDMYIDSADEVYFTGVAPATDTAEALKPSTPSEVMPEEPDTKELADKQMSVDESSKPATSAVTS